MNTPQIFNFEQNEVRTMLVNDEPYFVGKDVAKILGYSNTPKAIRDHIDEEDKTQNESFTVNGTPVVLINESGLYSLIIKSKLPSAKKFIRWVTSEVLPQIRKHGAYLTDQKAMEITTNPNSLADLLLQAGEQLKQKDIVIQQLEPKALFFDAVNGSTNSCLVKDLSVLLKQKGIDIGQNRLFRYLRENGYLGKGNGHYNKPTQRALDRGLFEYRENLHTNSNGEMVTKFTPLVTGKGQTYFVNKFLESA